jgi:hypothetical protein
MCVASPKTAEIFRAVSRWQVKYSAVLWQPSWTLGLFDATSAALVRLWHWARRVGVAMAGLQAAPRSAGPFTFANEHPHVAFIQLVARELAVLVGRIVDVLEATRGASPSKNVV